MSVPAPRSWHEDEPIPCTVSTELGQVTFERDGDNSASIVVENSVPMQVKVIGDGFDSNIQLACEEEIEQHVRTFEELHRQLMCVLSHDGADMTLRSTDKWTLDRRWKKSDNILTIHGADFRSTSSVNVVRGERPSDAALASAQLKNILTARVDAVRSLYDQMAHDVERQI